MIANEPPPYKHHGFCPSFIAGANTQLRARLNRLLDTHCQIDASHISSVHNSLREDGRGDLKMATRPQGKRQEGFLLTFYIWIHT